MRKLLQKKKKLESCFIRKSALKTQLSSSLSGWRFPTEDSCTGLSAGTTLGLLCLDPKWSLAAEFLLGPGSCYFVVPNHSLEQNFKQTNKTSSMAWHSQQTRVLHEVSWSPFSNQQLHTVLVARVQVSWTLQWVLRTLELLEPKTSHCREHSFSKKKKIVSEP